MHRIQTIKRISIEDYKRWIRSSKLIIVPILLIMIKKLVADPLIAASVDTGCKISVFEPFLALTNSGMILLLLPLCFVVLMVDFPICAGIDTFSQLRTSKRNYIISQLCFAFLAAMSYILFMFIATVVMSLGHFEIGKEFSEAVTHYDVFFPERASGIISELIPRNLYTHLSVFGAFISTSIMLFGYIMITALLQLLFAIIDKRYIGVLTNVIIILMGVITCSAKVKIQWLFPMAHTIPWIHYQEYYRKELFPLWGSFLYLGSVLLILIIMCIALARKYEIRKA